MNYLLATSRGGGVEKLMPKDTPIKSCVIPGGTYNMLGNRLAEIIPPPTLSGAPTHIYILAGIPDITHKVHHHSIHHHTECIYTDNPTDTLNTVKSKIDMISNKVDSLGAKPIFCTITNINVSKYNEHLLHSNKTSTLLHKHQYKDMQEKINTIIDNANKYIREKNRANALSTPFCHSAIRKRMGTKKKHYYTDDWEGLWDGVHATPQTRTKWANTISAAIRLNRVGKKRKTSDTLTSDEEKSPKRAWRRDRGDFGNRGGDKKTV